MTIAKDFVAKLLVAFVAAAMIVTAFAPAAQAQTTEDLQQMINDLLAQVAALQAGATATAPAGAPGVCPYTWTRDLSQGAEGADVMKLQQFLNSYPDLRVAATGAGSMGMETMYYGPATAAAVSKMQVMFRAEVLTPNGLVNPTGYFGASSRAKANDLCVADTTPEEVEEGEEGSEEEEEGGSMSLSGEGTLTTFEIDDEESEVAEGEEDVPVLRLTLEAENGDIEVSRLDFTLVADAGNEEIDPWDVFTEVSLWVDGDKIASFEADDEDEYLDEDEGEFRFSNLGLVLEEDEEVEIYVAVSVMNSVDGSDGDATWTIAATEMRYFDADGVAVTEDNFDEMGDTVEFDVVEEGTDDGADLEGSSNNPDAATLLVDEDTDDSDEYTVHIFDIEVDNDSGDLEVGDAYVDVTITNPSGGTSFTMDDVVDGIFMTIDGETVEGEATDILGTDNGVETDDGEIDHVVASTETNTVRFLFEFDQDVVLEGDEDYQVEVSMVFKGQDGDYDNGVTIETAVDGDDWEVEGAANDDELSGTDTSETHTLATVVPVISDTSFSNERNEATTQGTISFEFTVEADGDNDVTIDVADNADVDGTTDDIRFTVTGGSANATATLALIDGDANFSGGVWTINDGDEATFALDVAIDGTTGAGTYRVNVDTISGVEVDETSSGMVLQAS
jgi:hypothetical protein